MTKARIILICHAAPFGKAMAAAMRDRFGAGFVGVLAIDRRPGRRKTFLRKIKHVIKSTPLERRVERVEAALEKTAQSFFTSTTHPPAAWPNGVDVHTSADPNDVHSLEWLRKRDPDLIMVTGAPILKEHIFSLPRLGTFNMHSSLLPDYRGTQAEFWQVLENRTDTAGLTIHQVEKGVDTGAIVLQVPTVVDVPVSPQMLRTRNLIAAIKVVPDAIQSVLEGTNQPKSQVGGDVARRSKDKTITQRSKLLAKLGYPEFGDHE
jgi:methionyl-tRNA formyltransferase